MSLVVGHNCPGCGLDAPQVACEDCGGPVVWNREDGSHCSACGLSAAEITCPECGLRAELDRRPHEYRLPPAAVVARAEPDADSDDDEDEQGGEPRHRRLLAWAGTTLTSPAVRTLAIVLAVVVPASIVAPLLASRDQPGQAGGNIGVAARAPRDLTITTGLLPVPVQPPPPRPAEDLFPPKPPALATTWQEDRPVTVVPRPAPAQREGWFQRVLRSARATPPTGPRYEPINGN